MPGALGRHFAVVVNDAQTYALWPIGPRPPKGWRCAAFAGTLAACQRFVAQLSGLLGQGEPPPPRETVAAVLAEVAGRQPDAPAVELPDRVVRYAELETWSATLAAALRECGVQPGTRLLVLARPGLDLVVALLGALRVGACVMLVDPAAPRRWIRHLTADLGMSLVLAAGVEPPVLDGPRVLAWTAGRAGLGRPAPPVSPTQPGWGRSGVAVHSRAWPDAPAVVWSQAQLVRLAGACGLPPAGPGRRLRQLAAVGEPLLVVEVLRALLTGATLVLADDDTPVGEALTVTATPLTEALSGTAPAAALTSTVVRVRAGEVGLLGFPETMLLAAVDRLPDGLGSAVAGIRLHVLDGELRPVVRGEVGDLYAGGPGVAAGYLDRPAASAAAFLPDPYAGDGSGLMFRTGLLARERAEGGIDLVGGWPAP